MRQVSQTRFYVTESRTVTPHVSLFVGGLPPGLSPQEYSHLLHEAMATKGVTLGWQGLLAGMVLLPFPPFEPRLHSHPRHSPLSFLSSVIRDLCFPLWGPWTSRGQGPALEWDTFGRGSREALAPCTPDTSLSAAAVVSVSHVYNSQGELHSWTLEVGGKAIFLPPSELGALPAGF